MFYNRNKIKKQTIAYYRNSSKINLLKIVVRGKIDLKLMINTHV